jgi:hypothetical protein
LNGAPAISGFGSPPRKIAPHSPLTGASSDPFAGTPADHWGDGAVGIVLPAAGPVGGYTAAQVESAYVMTRKLLAAAFLDRKTLLGGRPMAFADLLTSQQETWFPDRSLRAGALRGLFSIAVPGYNGHLTTAPWVWRAIRDHRLERSCGSVGTS